MSEFGVHGKYLINNGTLNPNLRLLHRTSERPSIQTLGLNSEGPLVACELVHF